VAERGGVVRQQIAGPVWSVTLREVADDALFLRLPAGVADRGWGDRLLGQAGQPVQPLTVGQRGIGHGSPHAALELGHVHAPSVGSGELRA
jgi:hypothetical protein